MDAELQELRRQAKANPDDSSIQARLRRWLERSGYRDPIEVFEELIGPKIAKALGRPNNKTNISCYTQIAKILKPLVNAEAVEYPSTYLHYEHYDSEPERRTPPVPIQFYDVIVRESWHATTRFNGRHGALAASTLPKGTGIYTQRSFGATASKANGREKHGQLELLAICVDDTITLGFSSREVSTFPNVYNPYPVNDEQFIAKQRAIAEWVARGTDIVRVHKETVLDWIQKVEHSKEVKSELAKAETGRHSRNVFRSFRRWRRRGDRRAGFPL